MTKRLQDKVRVITGTGGSIGRAAAHRFAEVVTAIEALG